MELHVWIIFLAISLASFAVEVDSSCAPASAYTIKTTGCTDSIPTPQDAKEGLPFLPECEEGNMKCFRVQSDSHVALFLSPTPYISNPATNDYYDIRIQDDTVFFRRNGIFIDDFQYADGNILSGTELCVYFTSDGTLSVGFKNGVTIASWQDTIGPIDVNYILVQKYNDPDGEEAEFQFCEGVLKLLSQNTIQSALDKTVDVTESALTTTDAENVIDNKFNGGIFDSNVCHEIEPACTTTNPLGIEDETVADNQITASSTSMAAGVNHAAHFARLNQARFEDGSTGSWTAGATDPNQWIQVDLGTPTPVSGIITQGRDGFDQWVTMFTVEYSRDCVTWQDVDNGMVFTGNTDQSTKVTNTFTTPVSATLIRIRPTGWNGVISMRFELIGCQTGDSEWLKIDLNEVYDIKAVTMLVGQENIACPPKWSQYGSGCYIVINTLVTWDAAQADCQSKGGNLVTVRTQGLWHGNDGGTDHFENFFTTQPNNVGGGGGQDCIAERREITGIVANDFGWYDDHCDNNPAGYICQISLCEVGQYLYGGKCYWEGTLNPDPEWQEAEDDCVANGGHLVTIDSAETQAFLNDWQSGGSNFWIGLTDQTTEGQWVWIEDPTTTIWTGTGTGTAVGGAYENWFTDQPNDAGGDQDCGFMRVADEEWADQDCDGTNFRYICQKSQPEPCSYQDPLVDAKVYVGSCDENAGASELDSIKRNMQCTPDVSSSEISSGSIPTSWVLRQCNNYQGQYVYIVKEGLTAPLRLCEIEVWGKEVDDADKPQVGFVRDLLSDLEATLADGSPYEATVRKSGGSASNKDEVCCSFAVTSLTDLNNMATKASVLVDETDDFDDTGVPYGGPYEFTKASSADIPIPLGVTVHNDFCPAPDEQFGYQINLLDSACAVADPSVPTYGTTLFVIENDDVTYCWKDITLSVREDTGFVTATLTRTGYTDGTSVAYIKTNDDVTGANMARANVDYEAITTSPNTEVVFEAEITELPVNLTILQDEECEMLDETFLLVIDSATEGKICKDINNNVLDTVRITTIHDDVVFRFQLASYRVTETKREVEVVVELENLVDGGIDRDVIIGVKSQPLNPSGSLIAAMPEDYQDIDEVLTITAGLTTASITVIVNDDKLVEADVESFQLILVKQPLNSSDCILGDQIMTHIMIEDDDCCWRVEEEEMTTNEGDGKVDISVTCARESASAVVPKYPVTAVLQIRATGVTGQPQATLSEDYTLSSITNITINSAISATSTWSFKTQDDTIAEPPEYLDVSLESAYDGELCGPLTTRVAIEDNDVSVRIASCGDDNRIPENGGKLRVILERIGDDSGSTSVLFYTDSKAETPDTGAGVGDYDYQNVVVTFPAFQNKIVQDIVINNDLEQENDETFEVFISKSSQNTVVDSTANSCEVTILDDDYDEPTPPTPSQGLGFGAIFIIIGSILAGLILIGGTLLCLVIRRRARGLSIVSKPPTGPQTEPDPFQLVPLGYGGNAYGLPRNGFGYPSTGFRLPRDAFGNVAVGNNNRYDFGYRNNDPYGFGYP
ncbi:uncharacterized protein [Amphiura filiformis]|uniref:uncharacterized protein n=1 Tax=Amphiura filiformis TaxID=82378 RepID=UPI003B21B478